MLTKQDVVVGFETFLRAKYWEMVETVVSERKEWLDQTSALALTAVDPCSY